MGVKGLWKLLEPAAQPVSSLEVMRGQIVAIDISMWAHRFLKGGTGSHERALLSTFSRISKLLYYGIRPVFVFDGAPPRIKLETQRRRRTRREAASQRVERLRRNLVGQVVEIQAAAAAEASQSSSSYTDDSQLATSAVADRVLARLRDARQVESENDIFKLSGEGDLSPLSPSPSESESADSGSDDDEAATDGLELSAKFDDDDDEALLNSAYFNELPPEVRHDMLLEMKTKRKYAATIATTQGGAEAFLPQDMSDFSKFQLRKALAGSKIAGKLREAQRDIAANAVERAGADSTLLRGIFFSGAAGRTAQATEIRVETGGASACSEYVFVRSRRQFDSVQSIAGIKSAPPKKPAELIEQARLESLSNESSKSSSIISAPSNHFMKIGVFDSSSYAIGAQKKKPIAREIESDDEFEEPQLEPTVIVQSSVSNVAKLAQMPLVTVTDSAVILSDDDSSVESPTSSSNVDDFEDVEPVAQQPAKHVADKGKEPIHNATTLAVKSVSPPVDRKIQSNVNAPIIVQPEPSSALITVQASPESPGLVLMADSEEVSQVTDEEPTSVTVSSQPSPPSSSVATGSTQNTQLEDMFGTFRGEATDRRQNAESALFEFGREQRSAAAPCESFYSDVAEMCRAFGFPIVESPAEAEAQAAAMDAAGQVSFCITDDSDYWLFGGQRVVRGLFGGEGSSGAACTKYDLVDIEQTTGLDRAAMVCVALISGSDYSEGLRGCGPALGLDIWREFNRDDSITEDEQILDAVRRFKDAVLGSLSGEKTRLARSAVVVVENFLRRRKQADRRRVGAQTIDVDDLVDDRFPSAEAVDAFLRPRVTVLAPIDEFDTEPPLKWIHPDLERLKAFAKRQWNWQASRTESVLVPILRRHEVTNKVQPTLSDLWHVAPTITRSSGTRSRRVPASETKRRVEPDSNGNKPSGSQKRRKRDQ